MNQLSRNKILVSIIAILLVTNLVMLVLFFKVCRHSEKAEKKLGFTEKLRTEVGFTPEQMSVYEPRKTEFWKEYRDRFEEIKKTKEDFYFRMYDSTVTDSVLESKAGVIGDQQKEIDLHVVRYFKEVRKLCTPKQLPKYDSLLPAIVERMTARPSRK